MEIQTNIFNFTDEWILQKGYSGDWTQLYLVWLAIVTCKTSSNTKK